MTLDKGMGWFQICSARLRCRFVRTGEWVWAGVVNAEFAYLLHLGVNGYADSAFAAFARICSPVCAGLRRVCAGRV